jgi:hypothetical protein
MDWFKTKKSAPESTTSPEHLLALVRTMEDDVAGREIPTGIAKPAEPLVTFRPDAAVGAPFFAAPGVATAPQAESVPAEASPFLVETVEAPAEIAVEAPTFDPPLPAAVPDITPSEGSETVAFTTDHQLAAPAFQASMPRIFRGLLGLFQDRRIRIVSIVAAILLLAAMSAGGYFWWQSVGNSDGTTEVKVESPKMPEATLQAESQIQAKYSNAQPNILSFDTETVTADQIKSALLQAGQAIQKDSLPGAVEFLIRDQKLNPLAFSRFAYLARLNVPTELLGTLDEPFSLYIFIDDGRPRVALLAYAKDTPAFEAELKKHEKNLAGALEPLFLDVTTAPKTNLMFRDGAYLERPVRFANVDASLGLSIDYAVRGRQWIIGTSKDSLRSVLDKTGL